MEADLHKACTALTHEKDSRRQFEAASMQQVHALTTQVTQLQDASINHQEELRKCAPSARTAAFTLATDVALPFFDQQLACWRTGVGMQSKRRELYDAACARRLEGRG
jgi:hypothetical protein